MIKTKKKTLIHSLSSELFTLGLHLKLYHFSWAKISCYKPKEKKRWRDKMRTNPDNVILAAGSGGRLMIRLICGLWLSDDLPTGGRVAYVSGTPATCRPCEKAKAAGQKRHDCCQTCSRGLWLNIVQDWESSQEMTPMLWFTHSVCGVFSFLLQLWFGPFRFLLPLVSHLMTVIVQSAAQLHQLFVTAIYLWLYRYSMSEDREEEDIFHSCVDQTKNIQPPCSWWGFSVWGRTEPVSRAMLWLLSDAA